LFSADKPTAWHAPISIIARTATFFKPREALDTIGLFAFSLSFYGASSELLKRALDGSGTFLHVLPLTGFADIVPVVLAGAQDFFNMRSGNLVFEGREAVVRGEGLINKCVCDVFS
jgi:hypothetical protein